MKQLHGTNRPDRMPATTSNTPARLLAHIPPAPDTIASDERAAYNWLVACEELH